MTFSSLRLSAKARRVLRRFALVSLTVFAAAVVLAMAVSMVSAGDPQFWHVWGWFGCPG